jgi:ring-1,2-phenylacetyl-CoA epoxidase subunit PaaC
MANPIVHNTTDLLKYTLQLADNALIIGHRLSEWCGHGPILEQDIALSNISLDHLGQCRSLYQHAAGLLNDMPEAVRQDLFMSPLLQQVSGPVDEDDLAFLRDGWDFRNLLLLEQPNEDWAYTVARSFYFDTFNYYLLEALQRSADPSLAAIAEKSLKEVTYHMRWSSEWVIRLGDGTEESHQRMQAALEARWSFTGELFTPSPVDSAMLEAGIAPDLSALQLRWQQRTEQVIAEAGLQLPKGSWMQQGGKEGRHSEQLGYLLAEMQFMQRAYPNMEW